jgi:hypothetical protein
MSGAAASGVARDGPPQYGVIAEEAVGAGVGGVNDASPRGGGIWCAVAVEPVERGADEPYTTLSTPGAAAAVGEPPAMGDCAHPAKAIATPSNTKKELMTRIRAIRPG